MATISNETATPAIDPKLQAAFNALVAFMPDPVIRVAAGSSGFAAICDMRKVHPKVGLELLRQGAIKPLTDISRDKQTDETAEQMNARRLKKIANWYAGDFSVRGGGVADPVGVQMKEEIVAAYKAKGAHTVDPAGFKELTKGRADEILARVYDGDELTAALARYRALAESTLKMRSEAAPKVKIDLKSIKI